MLFVIHSGQTGVERGAHEAARASGLGIAGFMSREQRDELGPLPRSVSERLLPFVERGLRPAIRANLLIASAALLVVPVADNAEQVSAMRWVLQGCRGFKLPHMICDPRTNVAQVADWLSTIPRTCGSRRVVVTGPRATRWEDGETVTRRLVLRIGAAMGESPALLIGGSTHA